MDQDLSGKLIPSEDRRRSFSSREVAQYTGITLRVIQKYAKQGKIPGAFRPVGRAWRFRRKELQLWWAAKGN